MSINVQCDVRTIGDGLETPKTRLVVVRSHWNNDKTVELNIGETTVRVSAQDLIAAIQNCTNTNRFG